MSILRNLILQYRIKYNKPRKHLAKTMGINVLTLLKDKCSNTIIN